MTFVLSRAVMALALSCLVQRRSEWAHAMEVEFEAASEDGKPLAFAFGCLIAAWRELPAHEEGCFIIASQMLAFLLILPMAALVAASIFSGFPGSYIGPIQLFDVLGVTAGQEPLLTEANRSAIPALAALIFLLAGAHLRIAWLVLERDWGRAATLGMLMAAATMALTIFTSLVFAYGASALAQAGMLATELAIISALARWHARSLGGPAEAPT